jgi:hypothetical protein
MSITRSKWLLAALPLSLLGCIFVVAATGDLQKQKPMKERYPTEEFRLSWATQFP